MDSFNTFPTTPISPARSALAVIASDTTDLPQVSRALYIGTGGDLNVEMVDGDIVTFEAVPGGSLLPIRVNRVNSSGTTAVSVIALW